MELFLVIFFIEPCLKQFFLGIFILCKNGELAAENVVPKMRNLRATIFPVHWKPYFRLALETHL